jgi:cellulose synthase/poly-beta-1,6-N-acetylglucosamine synthase-like glycosyltransferase
VRYGRPLWLDEHRNMRTLLLTALSLAFEIGFVVWLLQSGHLPAMYGTLAYRIANVAVTASIVVLEVSRLINVVNVAVASLSARNPVPVEPPPDLRVAFLTTIVPSKEPLELVRETLQAARRVRYPGGIDVWLLDEGDDEAVRSMCRQLGVHHFSRRGVARWNQPSGPFKAGSKHGNYNAWVDAHGDRYDVYASVDPDHRPTENYLERILGYFRDPDVAFAVGPQSYANCDNFVTAAAESQQFPFHSIIQRAANRSSCAMLVGTNNAIRVSALRAIGGLRDSITEDLVTGFYFHTSRNPDTGRRWKSVYTPDVLAHGEGPDNWTDYFSQQSRWSRGTFQILGRDFWRRVWRLGPGQLMHYALILNFYPSIAGAWVLGAINSLLYLVVGASGIHVAPTLWLALYADTTATQLLLYFSNRRYNVSPYDVDGAYGLTGMLMSIVSSPVYASALVSGLLQRRPQFVVTPKGSSRNRDSMRTFRRHLQWAALFAAALCAGMLMHHVSPVVCLWPMVACVICLLPLGVNATGLHDARTLLTDRAEVVPLPRRPEAPRELVAAAAGGGELPATHFERHRARG